MQKAFSFTPPEDSDEVLTLVVNDEPFNLADDVTGIELLKLIAGTTTLNGVVQLLSRTILDGDWDRFVETTAKAKVPGDFNKIGSTILDLYSRNPTTAAAGS